MPRITTDEEVEWLGVAYDLLFEQKVGAFEGGYFDLARSYDAEGDDVLPQVLSPEHRFPQLRETVYFRNARRMASALLGVGRGCAARVGTHDLEARVAEATRHPGTKTRRTGQPTRRTPPSARGCRSTTHRSRAGASTSCRARTAGRCSRTITSATIRRCTASRPTSPTRPNEVAVPIPAGAATFHHPRMIHYAGPNTTDRPRRAYANEFQLAPVAG